MSNTSPSLRFLRPLTNLSLALALATGVVGSNGCSDSTGGTSKAKDKDKGTAGKGGGVPGGNAGQGQRGGAAGHKSGDTAGAGGNEIPAAGAGGAQGAVGGMAGKANQAAGGQGGVTMTKPQRGPRPKADPRYTKLQNAFDRSCTFSECHDRPGPLCETLLGGWIQSTTKENRDDCPAAALSLATPELIACSIRKTYTQGVPLDYTCGDWVKAKSKTKFNAANIQHIVPGNGAVSYLYMKVSGHRCHGKPMPIATSTGEGPIPMSQDEIKTLLEWIDDGAPLPLYPEDGVLTWEKCKKGFAGYPNYD